MGHIHRNLEDQVFGKLVVIECVGRHPKFGGRIWDCLCECGNTCVVRTSQLSAGKKHCGCEPRSDALDLTGKRFGMLTVLYRVPSKKERTRWQCACDCGGFNAINTTALMAGLTKSCGCMRGKNRWKKHNEAKALARQARSKVIVTQLLSTEEYKEIF